MAEHGKLAKKAAVKTAATTALSTVRLLPWGAGLFSTVPVIPLTAALEVPKDGDKEKWLVSDQLTTLASLQLVTERTTIERVLDVEAGGSGVISGVRLGFNAGYSKTIRKSEFALTVIVAVHVITQSKRFADFKLTTDAEKVWKQGPDAFSTAYGDHFCSEKQYGGVLVAAGRYATSSSVLQEQIASSVQLNAVWFGAWGDVQSRLSSIIKRENFVVDVATEGVLQNIPPTTAFANATAFINVVNGWIDKAAKNTTVPIRDYFTPYSAVPAVGKTANVGDYGDFRNIMLAKAQGQDLLQSILDVEANPDAFQGSPGEKKKLVVAARIYGNKFLKECDDELDRTYRQPMRDIQVPSFTPPALPEQNAYSIDAIYEHLMRGHKIKITLDDDIKEGTTEKVPLAAGAEYEVFIRAGNIWYCIPSSAGTKRPSNVTTLAVPVAGELKIWKILLRYDNTGEVVHTSGVKGRIQVQM